MVLNNKVEVRNLLLTFAVTGEKQNTLPVAFVNNIPVMKRKDGDENFIYPIDELEFTTYAGKDLPDLNSIKNKDLRTYINMEITKAVNLELVRLGGEYMIESYEDDIMDLLNLMSEENPEMFALFQPELVNFTKLSQEDEKEFVDTYTDESTVDVVFATNILFSYQQDKVIPKNEGLENYKVYRLRKNTHLWDEFEKAKEAGHELLHIFTKTGREYLILESRYGYPVIKKLDIGFWINLKPDFNI